MKEIKKVRTIDEIKFITKRLNIISGQIEGIKNMVDTDRTCFDVLIQISSVTKALNSLGKEILRKDLEKNIIKDIKNDKLDNLDEFLNLYKMMN